MEKSKKITCVHGLHPEKMYCYALQTPALWIHSLGNFLIHLEENDI